MFAPRKERLILRMKTKLLIAFVGFWLLVILACQPDEEILLDEPRLRMTLINQDSLDYLDSVLVEIDSTLDTLASLMELYSDLADSLQDSIFVLSVLQTDSGRTDLDDEYEIISILWDEAIMEFDYYDAQDSAVSYLEDSLEEITEDISSGLMVITSIENSVNGNKIEYDIENDSSTVWPLPLDMNADETSLLIEIADQIYGLRVTYSRTTKIDEYNNVVIEASGLSIDDQDHDFDSLYFDCATSECIDSDTELYLYF